MKWIFTLSTLIVLTSAEAQPSPEYYEKFCEVWTTGRNLSGFWEVYADSGQSRSMWNPRQMLMRDRRGLLRFQSKMAALNWLGERGWTLVSTHTTSEATAIQNISDVKHYYLFRKTAPKDELYRIEREVREMLEREERH